MVVFGRESGLRASVADGVPPNRKRAPDAHAHGPAHLRVGSIGVSPTNAATHSHTHRHRPRQEKGTAAVQLPLIASHELGGCPHCSVPWAMHTYGQGPARWGLGAGIPLGTQVISCRCRRMHDHDPRPEALG